MENGFIERRRSPRAPMGRGVQIVRPLTMAVRLLDVSSEGVLLSCPDPVSPGAMSRVTARLGNQPLDAELDVRHVSAGWDERVGGYRVGGRFHLLGPQARLAVESLLSASEHRD